MIDDLYMYSCANWTPEKPTEEQAPGPSALRVQLPFFPKQIMSWQTYSHLRQMGASVGKAPQQKSLVKTVNVIVTKGRIHVIN